MLFDTPNNLAMSFILLPLRRKRRASILSRDLNEKIRLPCEFEFKNTVQHRGVLVLRGKFSDRISNVDPEETVDLSEKWIKTQNFLTSRMVGLTEVRESRLTIEPLEPISD